MSVTDLDSMAAPGRSWAASRPRRRVAAAVFGLLIIACVVAGLATMAAGDAEHWAAHTITVRERAAMLSGALSEAETSERGYLLTGQDGYRTDFEAARAHIPALTVQLKALVQDNPDQKKRMNELAADLDARMVILDRAIGLVRSGQGATARDRIKLGRGRLLSNKINAEIAAFSAEEAALFDQRSSLAKIQRFGSLGAILFSIFAAMALAIGVGRTARRYRIDLEANNAALQHEIAERERTEGQLRQAQKVEALGRLTGGVAHDFNNVLAIIIGNLDLALKRISEERAHRLVSNALEGAHRAASLTQRLLAFSRQQPLEPRAVDVNRCVTDTSNLLHRVLGEIITIETVLGAGAWRALVDPSQLESAILNLAINARDAMPEGGKLTLETSNTYLDQAYADEHDEVEPGQYVMLGITDTGTGMTAEVMSRAFDPFFTTKPVGSGTGLGLSQVFGFIKQSGGHVKLYSEVGVGTSVKLYLPRSLTAGDAPVETVALAKRDVTGLTVLVVEDADQVREFAVEALQHLGYQARVANGAQQALELLSSQTPVDLLLTDVVMPGLNGRKLVEEAQRLRAGLRVLYMTGYTRNAIVHNGVLDTGTHLITKPFTVAQLDRALRTALDEPAPV